MDMFVRILLLSTLLVSQASYADFFDSLDGAIAKAKGGAKALDDKVQGKGSSAASSGSDSGNAGPKHVSDKMLAFEDWNGACDVDTLPKGIVPVRLDGVATETVRDIYNCEMRYLSVAKASGATPMTEDELSHCSNVEYKLKQVEAGKDPSLPSDSFERAKIAEQYTPMIKARIARLKHASQFCLSPRQVSVMHYDVKRRATPIFFTDGYPDHVYQPLNALGLDDVPAARPPVKDGVTYSRFVMFRQTEEGFNCTGDCLGQYHRYFPSGDEEAKRLEEGVNVSVAATAVYFTVTSSQTKGFRRDAGGYEWKNDVRTYDNLLAHVTRIEMPYKARDGKEYTFVAK